MKLNCIPKVVSYKERAYQEIKKAILNQQLKAGDVLNERTLAEQLGISRTPIREALNLLESEGWVLTEPCKGTWVKEISLKDIAEIYQMRLVLEELAVELIIKKLNEEIKNKLMDLLKQQTMLDDCMDTEQFTDIDMNFHLYLARISDNTRLFQTMNNFMDIMNMYLLRTIRKIQPNIIPRNEHIEIITAILQQDIPAAKLAVNQHISKAYIAAKETLN